jgi:HrpA-like RNA helicase
VKQAFIHSLIKSDGKLKNGTRSLGKNGVHGLSWACAASEEKVIHSILVWHVATTICKHQLDAELAKKYGNKISSAVDTAEHSVPDSSWVDTASSLSQYCAYLVAFAPDLLPGHSFDSASILDEAIEDARLVPGLQHAKTMEKKCQLLLDKASIDPQASKTMEKKSQILDKAIEDTGKLPDLQAARAMEEKCQILDRAIEDTRNLPDLEAAETTEESIVLLGARLAKALTEKIPNKKQRWKVLSEFWAEMTLYIAPCDDAQARAHLEALARGGEFITHLWALLTHAGVLKPAPIKPLSSV